jgi:methylenetetrahydrofolate dehydrogenase (NADP+)/methenyltetrahydrofolate cyclohydrolase/formyltetrahydrofolate synthetase
MTAGSAKVIDGTSLAKCVLNPLHATLVLTVFYRSIRQGVADRIKSLQAKYPRFQPQLAVVQVGERQDSTTYIRMKSKAAEEVGIKFEHIKIPPDAEVDDIIRVVEKLNNDERVSGVLVQLPLGDHIKADGERRVTEAISPQKDVDG